VDSRPAEQVIGELLGPDERLLWSGQPRQGLILRSTDAAAIPFSIFWTAFSAFWTLMALRSSEKIVPLFGIPFLAIGLYLLIGRFFVDSWQRARTRYGLTTQRVLIVSDLFRRSIKSLNLRTLSDVTLTERSNGTGTITFGPAMPQWPYRGVQIPGMSAGMAPSFDQIPDARAVFDQIRKAQA